MQVKSLGKPVKIETIAAVLTLMVAAGCSRIPELPTELPGPITQSIPAPEPVDTATPQVPPQPAPRPQVQQEPTPQLEPIPVTPPPPPVAQSAPIEPQPIPEFQPEAEVQLLTVPATDELTPAQNASLPRKLNFTVLHKANYNPLEKDNGKSFKALISEEIYNAELLRHSVETPKSVNFSTSQVLASSAGQRPSGGYTIGVTEIEEIEDRVVATVVQVVPGPGCITTPAVSFPFEFVVVPSRKPIEIFERQRTQDC